MTEGIKEKISILNYEINEKESERYQLKKDLRKLVIETNYLITDLLPYKGKTVSSVKVVLKDGSEECFYDDGVIDNNGKLDICNHGEMSHWGYRWNNNKNSYVIHSCFGDDGREVEILGFYDLKLEEE